MFITLYPNYSYTVLDVIQAGSADVLLDDGVFYVGDPLTKLCNYRDMIVGQCFITASVAETLQQNTLTATAANNSTYELIIQQYNPNTGTYYYGQWSHTTAASGASATTIANFFATAIQNQTNFGSLQITATGGATLVLDALPGYPTFIATVMQIGGGFANVVGTPGVSAVGTLAALALLGITVTNAAYTTIHIAYSPTTGYDNKDNVTLLSYWDGYINEGDGDAAALIATIRYLLAGRETSIGGPSNPESYAII